MKNLVFIFAVMLGVSFVSCNSSSKAEVESVDSTEIVTDSVEFVDSVIETDSIVPDSI